MTIVGFFLLKGQYHRLDKFQEDVFCILEKAREISHSDTEVCVYVRKYDFKHK